VGSDTAATRRRGRPAVAALAATLS
jgi:hypothetical protein